MVTRRCSVGLGDAFFMTMSTIAAVIPTFNRAGPLRRALDSVVAQTRPPEEVIVVDDGSSDGTHRMIESAYPHVRLVRQENRGVAAARNEGIARASSDWIALLDSDDEWRPRKLERQMAALGASPDYRICHTDEIWIRSGRRVNPRTRHAKTGGHIFRRCLPLCAISPSAAVIERSLLLEVDGFDATLPVCEDYDLWLRICSRYPVLFVNETLVVKHGGHEDQLSRRYWGMDRFRIRALERVIEGGRLRPDDREAAVATLVEKIGVYVEGARKRGKHDEVEAYLATRRRYEKEQTWQRNTGS